MKLIKITFFRLMCLGIISVFIFSCSFYTIKYNNEEKIEIIHTNISGKTNYEVSIDDEPVDIIFSFTNINEMVGSDSPDVDEASVKVNNQTLATPLPFQFDQGEAQEGTIHSFIKKSTEELVSTKISNNRSATDYPIIDTLQKDIVGQTNDFTVIADSGGTELKSATCRSVTGPISTDKGSKTLNVWVSDDCWEAGGTKKHLVTPEMINSLEDRFLKAGESNDIYDWVTNIIGEEWGDTGYSNLIGESNEITILLSDIDNDNSDNGGVVGYFWPANNYTDTSSGYPGSNERIMFVVDAVMYANPSEDGSSTSVSSGWTETAYWPKTVFSTLAHEFQHMIHFYQKQFVENANSVTEIWVDEMCSLLVEDFLSSKLNVSGPRGVSPNDPSAGPDGNTGGRLPYFNQYLMRPLTVAYPDTFQLEDYPVAYAFGAWLARNYGGVDLLHRIVNSSYTDERAIVSAVQYNTGDYETFGHLLERWGGAIFLSNAANAPQNYQYNSGEWFSSSTNGIAYNLGSINLYNYNPEPEFLLDDYALNNTLNNPSTNVYLLVEQNATGKHSWDIEIPEDVHLSVILKKH